MRLNSLKVIIKKILASLVVKRKDPNDSSFEISDIISAISGGNNAGVWTRFLNMVTIWFRPKMEMEKLI
jgi:hypothetical protein